MSKRYINKKKHQNQNYRIIVVHFVLSETIFPWRNENFEYHSIKFETYELTALREGCTSEECFLKTNFKKPTFQLVYQSKIYIAPAFAIGDLV